MNQIERIEHYLFRKDTPSERLLFEASLLLDDTLREKMHLQEEAYDLIHHHGRNKLSIEIKEVHHTLFHTSKYTRFRNKVLNLFTTHQ